MPIHPALRTVQLGLRALGHDPGPTDGWWGPRTTAAATGLLRDGPASGLAFGARNLQRGLARLGYSPGPADGWWGPRTAAALASLITARGAPVASAITGEAPPAPAAAGLNPAPHGREIRQGAAGYLVDSLMLHTTATPGGWASGRPNHALLEEVRRWHTLPVAQGGRGWRDIGYHRLICPDGEVLDGRPLTQIGAGAVNHNRGWIHVCMVPVRTITRMGQPADWYSPQTLATARAEVARIARLTPLHRLAGHNEVAAKLCPGFRVIDADWTHPPVT